MEKITLLSKILLNNQDQLIDKVSGVTWYNSNIPISKEVLCPYCNSNFSLDFSQVPKQNGNYYVRLDTNLNLGSNPFSFSCWAKITYNDGAWRNMTGPYDYNYITIWQSDPRTGARPALTWGGHDNDINQSNYSIDDGLWHNIFLSRASDNIVRLFVDGKVNTVVGIGTAEVKSQGFIIGNGYQGNTFQGYITDVRFSDASVDSDFDLDDLDSFFYNTLLVFNNLNLI